MALVSSSVPVSSPKISDSCRVPRRGFFCCCCAYPRRRLVLLSRPPNSNVGVPSSAPPNDRMLVSLKACSCCCCCPPVSSSPPLILLVPLSLLVLYPARFIFFDSNRVPNSAVLRNEPRLLRVRRCCCKALAFALLPPRKPAPGAADVEPAETGTSLSPSAPSPSPSSRPTHPSTAAGFRRPGCMCAWSGFEVRRKESFDRSEPDKVRRWLLLVVLAALPDRGRPRASSCGWTLLLLFGFIANAVALVSSASPSSIGASSRGPVPIPQPGTFNQSNPVMISSNRFKCWQCGGSEISPI